MTAKNLFSAILLTLFFARLGLAQGGPYHVDYIWRGAWPNPAITVQPSWLDDGVPATLLAGQTVYVPSTDILASKQKDYYWFQDKTKQSGIAHKLQIDNDSCRVWLEWDGYYYPSNGGYDCEYDAIPFDDLDPKCFTSLSGPYCDIPNGIHFVGQVNGFPWVAFSGLGRRMGTEFRPYQIENIFDRNQSRNEGELRSDLRAELVEEFLELFPGIDADEIPVDNFGDELTDAVGYNNTAVVCHIIPAIAPEGNAAGRNAYSNAMVVSSKMKKQLTNSLTGTGYMPSDAMLLYFEYLASRYGAKSTPSAESKFTAQFITDWKSLRGEVEFLTEDETRIAMEHAGMLRSPIKTRR